jgi:hypothetical protein
MLTNRRRFLLLPSGSLIPQDNSSGVEVALQCCGENSPDSGKKSGIGPTGRPIVVRWLLRGVYSRRQAADLHALRLTLLNLKEDSVYGGDGIPVARRRYLINVPSCS